MTGMCSDVTGEPGGAAPAGPHRDLVSSPASSRCLDLMLLGFHFFFFSLSLPGIGWKEVMGRRDVQQCQSLRRLERRGGCRRAQRWAISRERET